MKEREKARQRMVGRSRVKEGVVVVVVVVVEAMMDGCEPWWAWIERSGLLFGGG